MTTPEIILKAAHDVLRQHGVRALTLDKVATQAGLSKGGLIHHFPSKDALLLAMQDQSFLLASEELERQLALEPDTGQRGRFLRAYLNTNLACIQQGRETPFLNILELAVSQPELFLTKRDFFRQLQHRVENDGIDPTKALIIAGASDNLWIQAVIGVIEPHDPQIQQVHDHLIAMTR